MPDEINKTKEQEAFHSTKSYKFSIPDNIADFNKSNSNKSSKIISTFEDDSEKLPKEFKKLQINSNNDENEIIYQQIKKQNINVNDDDETYDNPNLHSKEQNELEIPDDGF
ncbi:unnamed protein product [Rhizophagus irregularis]|nr:unnamed protein product [Rhizophagus irregularis]